MFVITLKNDDITKIISNTSLRTNNRIYDGKVKLGINTIDSFTFTIFPNNDGYFMFNPLKTLVEVFDKVNGTIFTGRVLLVTDCMDSSGNHYRQVICESELGFLQDSCQIYKEFETVTLKEYMEYLIWHHNKQIEPHKQFEVGTISVTHDTSKVPLVIDYEQTFDIVKDLTDKLGGELRLRKVDGKMYLDYVDKIGEKKDTEIRLSKNLKTIEQVKDPSSLVTRVIPLGKKLDDSDKRIEITNINPTGRGFVEDIETTEAFGIVEKVKIWDEIEDPYKLIDEGKVFLNENNRVKKQHKVEAVDLSLIGLEYHSFIVGNTYRVINPLMNIDEDLRIIEKEINLDSPEESSLTIGDKFQDKKDYMLEYKNNNKKIIAANKVITSSVEAIQVVGSEVINTVELIETLDDSLTQTNVAVSEVYDSLLIGGEVVNNILSLNLRNGETIEINLTPIETQSINQTVSTMDLSEDINENLKENDIKENAFNIKESIMNIKEKLNKIKNIIKE